MDPDGPDPQPGPDWAPLARPGAFGVEVRRLLAAEELGVSLLRLAPNGTIDEHAAGYPIELACLEGEGYVSVEDRVYEFRAGLRLTWPARRLHRLWTGDRGMVVLVAERLAGGA